MRMSPVAHRGLAGVLELPGRLMRLSGAGHPALGTLLAVGLFFATLAVLRWDPAGRVTFLAVVAAAITAAGVGLAYRWPRTSLAVAFGGVLLLGMLNQSITPLAVGIVIAIYYVALRRPAGEAFVITLVTVAVGVLLARLLRGVAFTWQTLAQLGWFFCAGAFGAGVRAHRAYTAEVLLRAERAERGRDMEARRRVGEERLRIARELHDVVGHCMAMINVQAGVAAHVLDQNPEAARTALERIAEASREALREMRGTLGLLRSDPDTLAAARTQVAAGREHPDGPMLGTADLAGLVADIRDAGVPAELTVEGDDHMEMTSVVRATAYRIVQESLTNVLKHGHGVTAVDVRLRYGERDLGIEVTDDGEPAAETGNGGTGIRGMTERALAVGGTLSAGPRPGGGFTVRADLPGRAEP
jgi:signal transduction histidine kinase